MQSEIGKRRRGPICMTFRNGERSPATLFIPGSTEPALSEVELAASLSVSAACLDHASSRATVPMVLRKMSPASYRQLQAGSPFDFARAGSATTNSKSTVYAKIIPSAHGSSYLERFLQQAKQRPV